MKRSKGQPQKDICAGINCLLCFQNKADYSRNGKFTTVDSGYVQIYGYLNISMYNIIKILYFYFKVYILI